MVLYQINGPYTVRDSVTKIGDNVTTIYIPNSVETINSSAFSSLTNLT